MVTAGLYRVIIVMYKIHEKSSSNSILSPGLEVFGSLWLELEVFGCLWLELVVEGYLQF